MKDACTNTTMMIMTLSYLPSTETGVHKHCTASKVVEIGLYDIPGTEGRLYNPHRTCMTVKMALSDLRSTEIGVHKQSTINIYSCGNWALGHSWHCKMPAQPPQDHHRSENDCI